MFQLSNLPWSSTEKLPILDKSLATLSFEYVNGLKEIGEWIGI